MILLGVRNKNGAVLAIAQDIHQLDLLSGTSATYNKFHAVVFTVLDCSEMAGGYGSPFNDAVQMWSCVEGRKLFSNIKRIYSFLLLLILTVIHTHPF